MGVAAPVVEAVGLCKRYPGVLAVDRADLQVRAGQVVGLVGKNGAGKSTVIKILAGAVAPDSGTIRVRGNEVKYSSTHSAQQLGLSFVHQELLDVPGMTVAENVFLGHGYPKRGPEVNDRALRRSARPFLDTVGLSVDPGARVGSLRLAERRLVTIARALAWQSSLIVFDEPTAALTDGEVAHLHRIVADLRERGIGILYVSHRLDEIARITDRVVVMRDGRTVADRPTEGLSRAELIREIIGKAPAEPHPTRRTSAESATKPILEVADLAATASGPGVDLAVHPGEVLGIAGLVGSGRTELLRQIYGADQPARGTVRWMGRPTRIKSPRDALALGIAYLPEDRRRGGVVRRFNIRENATLASLDRHRLLPKIPIPSVRSERRATGEVMQALAVRAPNSEFPVGWLSGGNQQKVVLSRWLLRGAKVFLLDEPTQGIDVEAKSEIYEIVRGLARDGAAVVFVSSDFSELVLMCSSVIVMSGGQVVGNLRGSDITEEKMIAACYGGLPDDLDYGVV